MNPKRLKCISLVISALITSSTAAWQVPSEYAITASPDGHFFQDSSGRPFFWQADTAWLLFHRLNYSECETYLSDRASKGFNMVLAVGFTQIGIDSPNRNGDLPFLDEDPVTPNEPYWDYIDQVVELAWTKNIRIALVPAWGYYVHSSDNEESVLNIDNSRTFGFFVGSRYPYLPKILFADTNPYWENKTAVKADYANGGVSPEYAATDWSPIYDELAQGIIEGERGAIASAQRARAETTANSSWWPLMTIHPTNQWFNGGPIALASSLMGDRLWLTLDSSQSGHADYPPNPPIPWWNCRRGWETVERMYAVGETEPGIQRPVLDNEPHYENRYDNGKSGLPYWNASDIRIGSWQAVFSGAAGVTYGAENIMQMYNPDLFDHAGSGVPVSWTEDLSLAGAAQMHFIQQAITDRGDQGYFSRIPAQDVIMDGTGTNDEHVVATRDQDGSYIMVYTPIGRELSINTTSLSGCDIAASWFDPLTGLYDAFDYTQCGEVGAPGVFVPPLSSAHADWVLVLEKQ
ncbi:hypothetical protein F4778DRAFT_759991 [Xylariomycetidae sp. FL2044]|nr:hypothetical protein F4778DRAFT_759991 [Xylariomycetidae sp. FL2044]